MTPEAQARQQIDAKLSAAGWVVQDLKQLNLGAATGVAVREFPTDTGPADYLLFIDRAPVGVIEAKHDNTIDPAPRSRELFHFFRPEHLAVLLAQPDTLASFRDVAAGLVR
ncbi:hypothetical protein BH11PSE9_BH11PSE9_28720 [soil metagenome]